MPTPQPEGNPLRRGLVEDRSSDACAVVIFGASGDLTRRKLMPALYNLAVRALAPRRVRRGRRGAAREERRGLPRGDEGSGRRRSRDASPSTRRVWADFERGVSYVAGRGERPGDVRATSAPTSRRLDAERGDRGKPPLLPRRAAERVRPDRARACAARDLVAPVGARAYGGPWTRVVFEKPFGHDLDERPGAQRHHRRGLRRVAGLPHRPLPRQGDGAEPARLPLRQLALRAGLGPRARRPRADHGRRGHRRRGRAASSTSRRASRATSSRTT